jgi:hypothetical protein
MIGVVVSQQHGVELLWRDRSLRQSSKDPWAAVDHDAVFAMFD